MLIPDVLRAPTLAVSPDVVNGTALAILWGDMNGDQPGVQIQCLLGITADYSAAVSAIKTVTVKRGSGTERTGPLTATVLAIGSTDTKVSSTAFGYAIDSVTYGKAAVAAGTILATGTIPQDTWGIYLLSIDATGAITVTAGADNTTGYADEATAILALPETPDDEVSMGYLTVLTASGHPFVGGTDALQGGTSGNPSDDTNYYPTASIAPSTTVGMPFRWDFAAGPFYFPLPGVLRSERGGSISVELQGSGSTPSGRVAIYGCLV